MSTNFILSVEELAYALGLLGGAATAEGFLVSTLGPIPAAEIGPRLVSASHSLLARNWVRVDVAQNTRQLQADLLEVAQTILTHQYGLRATKRTPQGEVTLSYFVSPRRVVEHTLREAVCSKVELLTRADMLARLSRFVGLPKGGGPQADPVGELPAAVVQALRHQAGVPGALRALLAPLLPSAVVESLATELSRPQLHWGHLLKFKQLNSPAALESAQGLFFASGPTTGWLFSMIASETVASLYPGTSGTLKLLLEPWLA